MKQYCYKTICLATVVLMLAACDSGDIYDKEVSVLESGKVVKLSATISGVSDWDDDYNVALAAFCDDSRYAATQRVIPENTPDGQYVEVTLENLPSTISTVELALTDKLRKRILTLASMNIDDYGSHAGEDTIRMDLGMVRLDQRNCIQTGIFNVACIQCHGANGHSAAGLDLTTGVPAKEKLNQIITDGGASTLHYNHTEVLSSHFKTNLDEIKNLLHEWIEKYE